MINRYLLLAPLIGTVALAADRPALKSDMERLQGTWSVVALVNDGDRVPADALRTARFIVRGNQYRFTGAQRFDGTFSLKATAAPKQIDSTYVRGDVNVRGDVKETGVARGIYAFEADRLIICWSEVGSKERPRSFRSESKSGLRLIVMEKIDGR